MYAETQIPTNSVTTTPIIIGLVGSYYGSTHVVVPLTVVQFLFELEDEKKVDLDLDLDLDEEDFDPPPL